MWSEVISKGGFSKSGEGHFFPNVTKTNEVQSSSILMYLLNNSFSRSQAFVTLWK